MPSRRVEDHSTKWNHQDIAGISGAVTEDADEDQHRGEEHRGCDSQHRLDHRVNETRLLRHPDSEQGDQHHPQRVEAGEGFDHIDEELDQRRPGELVGDLLRFRPALFRQLELITTQEPGDHPGQKHGEDKENRRVRQLVPELLDGAQDPTRLRVFVRRFPLVDIHRFLYSFRFTARETV